MIPVKDLAHATEASARLTSMFTGRRIIEAMLKVFANRVQELENEIFTVLLARNLDSSNTWVLDTLGKLLQVYRVDRTNDEYREALYLRILILKSNGKRPALLKIINTAAHGDFWKYWDQYPAGILVLLCSTIARFDALADAIRQAKAGGIGGGVMYSPTDYSLLFIPDTVYGVVFGKLVPRGPSHTDGLPASVPVHVEDL